jgi:hypothetical protein
LALRAALEKGGYQVTIYGGGWEGYFGTDFTAFKDVPFVYAHYDMVLFRSFFFGNIFLKPHVSGSFLL